MQPMNKVLQISRILGAVFVVIIATLGLVGVIDIKLSNSITLPIIGVLLLLNGLMILKQNKAVAYFSFVACGFVSCVCIFVFTR